MRIGPFGIPELIIILGIMMLIFGARRIPELSQALGRGIRLFKKGLTDDDTESS